MYYDVLTLPNAVEIRELLRANILEVTFKKKDGSLREMICTLKPQYLPANDGTTSDWDEKHELITVWDLEAEGWRSFKLGSLISISYD